MSSQGLADPRLARLDELGQKMVEQEARLRKEISALKAAQPHMQDQGLIMNLKSGAVHRSACDQCSPPLTWSTTCGWKFGLQPFSREQDLPGSWKQVCGICLPVEKARLKDAACADKARPLDAACAQPPNSSSSPSK